MLVLNAVCVGTRYGTSREFEDLVEAASTLAEEFLDAGRLCMGRALPLEELRWSERQPAPASSTEGVNHWICQHCNTPVFGRGDVCPRCSRLRH